MSDFDRQFAIRLPDGSMFLVPEPAPNPLLPRFLMNVPEHRPVVAIWEQESDAQVMLDAIKEQARKVGVTNIGATIVSRVVGPWADPDLSGFIAAVEEHANGES
ncbi:hypothetical protein ACFVX3_31705 [Rhodococcus erythropolis]